MSETYFQDANACINRYVEVFEHTQCVLITTVQKLYDMVRRGDKWELAEPELNSYGQPIIHNIAEKLGCMRQMQEFAYRTFTTSLQGHSPGASEQPSAPSSPNPDDSADLFQIERTSPRDSKHSILPADYTEPPHTQRPIPIQHEFWQQQQQLPQPFFLDKMDQLQSPLFPTSTSEQIQSLQFTNLQLPQFWNGKPFSPSYGAEDDDFLGYADVLNRTAHYLSTQQSHGLDPGYPKQASDILASNETFPPSMYVGVQRGLVDSADGMVGPLDWNTGMGLEDPWAEMFFDCE
jgi:hypothetical protein